MKSANELVKLTEDELSEVDSIEICGMLAAIGAYIEAVMSDSAFLFHDDDRFIERQMAFLLLLLWEWERR